MCADTFVTSRIRNDDDKRASPRFKLEKEAFSPQICYQILSISDIWTLVVLLFFFFFYDCKYVSRRANIC